MADAPVEDDLDYSPDLRCGLYNLGNTCYFNASLQAVLCSSPFVSALSQWKECDRLWGPSSAAYLMHRKSQHGRRELARRLADLIREMFNGERSVNPVGVIRAVSIVNPMFRGYQQQDSQEVLRTILGNLDDEVGDEVSLEVQTSSSQIGFNTDPGCPGSRHALNVRALALRIAAENERMEILERERKANERKEQGMPAEEPRPLPKQRLARSFISDIFQGSLLSEVTCCNCQQVSRRIEYFTDISLSLPTRRQRMRLRSNHREAEPEVAQPAAAEDPSPVTKTDEAQNEGEDSAKPVDATAQSTGKTLITHTSKAGTGQTWGRYMWGLLSKVVSGIWHMGFSPSLGNLPLYDCLASFCDDEPMNGENRYYCGHCGSLQDAVKRLSFLELPEVLCLHVKRFRFNAYWVSKLPDYVEFPMDWETRPDVSPPSPSSVGQGESEETIQVPLNDAPEGAVASIDSINLDPEKERGSPLSTSNSRGISAAEEETAHQELDMLDLKDFCTSVSGSGPPPVTTYTLMAVVNHHGGSYYGGHYTSYVLKGDPPQWCLCNDSRLRTVPPDIVRDSTAYMLFYRKQPVTAPVPHALELKRKAIHYVLEDGRWEVPADAVYISRQWLHSLAAMGRGSAPGVIYNEMCYCDETMLARHPTPVKTATDDEDDLTTKRGRHLHTTAQVFYTPIIADDWAAFVEYFGGGPIVTQQRFVELQQLEEEHVRYVHQCQTRARMQHSQDRYRTSYRHSEYE